MYASTWYAVNQRRLVEPPETLWRVEHSGNKGQAVLSSRAAPQFHGWDHFTTVKRCHADWHNRTPTPFLSAFSNYRHAMNWANHRVDELGDRCVQIHEIDTDGLLVFGAGGDEYLILDEIPEKNVVETIDLRPPPPRRRRRGRRSSFKQPQYTSTTYYSDSSSDDW